MTYDTWYVFGRSIDILVNFVSIIIVFTFKISLSPSIFVIQSLYNIIVFSTDCCTRVSLLIYVRYILVGVIVTFLCSMYARYLVDLNDPYPTPSKGGWLTDSTVAVSITSSLLICVT